MKSLQKLSCVLFLALIIISCKTDDDDAPAPIIDLKAESITFSINKNTQFQGTATITGTVKNIGDNYVSGDAQQSVVLYQRQLGASAPGTEVGRTNFTSLNADETIEVSYTRDWNSSSPSEGEFPPDFFLVITYDADILIDGNVNNDDKNAANNEIMESGSAINDLFRN